MQTFLPYRDFEESAAVLDSARVWKQCVEAKQLLLGQFPHHPASKMWRWCGIALAQYGVAVCKQSLSRKIAAGDLLKFFEDYLDKNSKKVVDYPAWLGNEQFHASHRSNLLRKDWHYYSRFGWIEPDNLPYVWPN